ncbi:hypothetical protein TL16_g04479 [Triparma laevis f. inornata]|uniref:Uncharacterized protein n=1 Tax=Triparma laevis f. inornata TaxID=1714386 RepID=A0A9W7E3E3_9STRA|nr:hypothetical protein TL16_g04479 [Triparma laevis f. inornata]
MLSGLKFGSKKRKDPPSSSSSSSKDDQPPTSKYASSGTLKLPTGGLYDPKAPKPPPKSALPSSDNQKALQALRGNLNSSTPSTSTSSTSDSSTFLNLRAKPTAQSQDLRLSQIRRGTLKKSDHQKEYSHGGSALGGKKGQEVEESDKTLKDLIEEEKNAKSMDEVR